MAATAALVREVAPEFATLTDEQIAPKLRIAGYAVSAKRFGAMLNDAHALLTAHQIKMDPVLCAAAGTSSVSSGGVASESHGPASVSYASGSGSATDDELARTTYGQGFLRIRNRVRGRGSAIRVGNGTPQRS